VTPRLVFDDAAVAIAFYRLWERATAGCEVDHPLADQFYGDRVGRLRDPFGHQWMLSSHIEDVDRDEMDRRMRVWSDAQD
jgi:uncharacterized glyoxalase superfamily protein PhnB